MVWYPQLFKSFLQFIHTVKGFGTLDETEVDFFLEFHSFPFDPANVGNLISGSSSFSKPSLDIWKFLVHIMLKPSVQDFKHDHTILADICNCPVVITFFGTTLFGNWDEDWLFPVLWPLLGSRFSDLLNTTPWWHHPLGFWIVLLKFHASTGFINSNVS